MKLPTFCIVYKLEAFGRMEIKAKDKREAYNAFEERDWDDLRSDIQVKRKIYMDSWQKQPLPKSKVKKQ